MSIEENTDKTTDQSGYAKMDKMDQDKSYHYHHHGDLRMIFAVLVLILLMGIAFAIGRGTNRNIMMRGFGRTTNISVNRSVLGAGMMSGRGMMRGYRNGGGLAGQISTINGNTLTVKDTDGTGYTVNVASTTSIIINGKIDKVADLKTSAQVIVNGTSNSDGSINASVIRSTQ